MSSATDRDKGAIAPEISQHDENTPTTPEGARLYRQSLPSSSFASVHSLLSDSRLEALSQQHNFAATAVTPVDAANIRVLLVQIGPVRQGMLAKWVGAITQFSRIPISDIIPHIEPSLASPYSNGANSGLGMEIEGAIRFTFSTNTEYEYEYLEGLQTHRQTLGIIGIIDCKLCKDIMHAYDQFLHLLSQHTTAVAYRCLAFDPQADQVDDVPGITMIPNAGGSLLFYLQTLLNDFAGTMVSAISLMARSIEDRSDLFASTGESSPQQVPNSATLESEALSRRSSVYSDSRSDRQSLNETTSAAATEMTRRLSYMGNSPRANLTTSQPSNGHPSGPESQLGANERSRYGGEMDRDSVFGQNTIDNGPRGSKVSHESASMVPKTGSFIGNITSNDKKDSSWVNIGRLKKLQGDLYLMAGRLSEAFAAYNASIESSRVLNDYLWQAVALEGYCAGILLQAERTSERKLLYALLSCLPTTSLKSSLGSKIGGLLNKNGSGSNKQGLDDTVNLSEALLDICNLFSQVPQLYEHNYSFAPLLYAEACVRESLVLITSREAFLDDSEKALSSLLQKNSLFSKSPQSTLQKFEDAAAVVRGWTLRADINKRLQQGWNNTFSSLELYDQLTISSEISQMFRHIGYGRKSALFLRQFLLLGLPILLRSTASIQNDRERTKLSTDSHTYASSVGSPKSIGSLSILADGSSAFAAVRAAANMASASSSSSSYNQYSLQPASSTNRTESKRNSFDVYSSGDTTQITREWFSKRKVALRKAIVSCISALLEAFDPRKSDADLESGSGGWVHIQSDIIRECLSISETLPSYSHALSAAFCLVVCLKSLEDIVPSNQKHSILEEERMLRNYIHRTAELYHQRYHADPNPNLSSTPPSNCSQQFGDEQYRQTRQVVGRDAHVFGNMLDSLLVGVQFCHNLDGSVPIHTSPAKDRSDDTKPLFLYDPSATASSDTIPLIVADEPVWFSVTLRNPFPFALTIEDATLVGKYISEQNESESESESNLPLDNSIVFAESQCTIPASGTGCLLLKATPKIPGKFLIYGIKVTVFKHLLVICLLPDESDDDAKRRLKKIPLQKRLEKEHRQLFSDSSAEASSNVDSQTYLSPLNPGYSLPTLVVPQMPLLQVMESSIMHEGSLSLLEGEEQIVVFTLFNDSEIDATDLDIRFEPFFTDKKLQFSTGLDSNQGDLVNASFSYSIRNGKSQLADVKNDDDIGVHQIQKHQICEVHIRVIGLASCQGGNIILQYKSQRTSDWKRELRWPLRTTVSRVLIPASEQSNSLTTKYIDLPPYIARALGNSSTNTSSFSEGTADIVKVLKEVYSTDASTSESFSGPVLVPQDLYYVAELNIKNDSSSEMDISFDIDFSLNTHDSLASSSSPNKTTQRNIKTIRSRLPGNRALSRIVLPMPRILLDYNILNSPIPGMEADSGPDTSVEYPWHRPLDSSLESSCQWRAGTAQEKPRQFVVLESSNLSGGELSRSRALYWYQQAVADRIRIKWRSHHLCCEGYLDPRSFIHLDERSLQVVQLNGLQTRIFVGEHEATYIDKNISEINCITETPTILGINIYNGLAYETDLDISVDVSEIKLHNYRGYDESSINMPCTDNDNEYSEYDRVTNSTIPAGIGAAYNTDYTMQDMAQILGVEMNTSFANSISRSLHTDKSFRFKHTLRVETPIGLDINEGESQRGPHVVPPSQRTPEHLDSIIFDRISNMKLRNIGPGCSTVLDLPVYLIRPGKHYLQCSISTKPFSEETYNPGTNTFQCKTIVINAQEGL